MKAKGLTGELRIGGRVAAVLGPWRMRPQKLGWRLQAPLRWRDEFWIEADGPFDLHLEVGEARWRFHNVFVDVGDEDIEITGREMPEVT
jgi:hypothetical protein